MLGEKMERRRAANASRRKRVEQMTEGEKMRALLTDELTGLGNRRAWEEGSRRPVQAAIDGITRRVGAAGIEATLPDGPTRRLKGARVHAGIGRSLDEADAALNSAKKAGIAAGERAERGDRPRGLSEVRVLPFSKRAEPRDLRFFLRAFREADPDFGEEKDADTGGNMMSREWLIRNMR